MTYSILQVLYKTLREIVDCWDKKLTTKFDRVSIEKLK